MWISDDELAHILTYFRQHAEKALAELSNGGCDAARLDSVKAAYARGEHVLQTALLEGGNGAKQ